MLCPNFPASGQCDDNTVHWCGPTMDGQTPAGFDCGIVNASCATDDNFGAWCAAGPGAPCVVNNTMGRAGYLFCGDAHGPSAALACDLEQGCVQGSGSCMPGMATAPTCQGNQLVVDCTPWGQPVVHDCIGLGGTGCSMGHCVTDVPDAGCSGTIQCDTGFVCDPTTKTCAFKTAMHLPLPQEVNLGGPVVMNPKVVAIAWAGDPMVSHFDKVIAELTGSGTSAGYWTATTSEYGVGPISSATIVHIMEAIPSSYSDSDLTTLIKLNTTGPDAGWGPIDPETIYVLAVPSGVKFDDGTGSKCCSSWDGYHYEANQAGTRYPYAVVCSCPGGFDGPAISDNDQLSVVTSHELVEAATDPFVNSNPAYAQPDENDLAWLLATDGELADMCEDLDDTGYLPAGSVQKVQRTWSNRAAAAGQDPCVPALTPFAGTEPVMPDTGSVIFDGPMMTKVVKIAIGQTRVVDLPMFSAAPVGYWQVVALDYNSDFLGNNTLLKLKLDKETATNGDVLHLSITPMGFDSSIGGALFFIESVQDDGTESLAMGVVQAP
jgi:hypothetical protein